MHEVPGLGDGDEAEFVVDPLPGVIQCAGEQGCVVKAMNHQHRTLHLGQLGGHFIRLAGVVRPVVIEHAFEGALPEGGDILLAGLGFADPAGDGFGGEGGRRPGKLKGPGIGAVLPLLGIGLQFAQQSPGMGEVEDHQPFGQLGMPQRHIPGNCPAPIVPDDGGPLASQVPHHGHHIGHQLVERVILDAGGLVAGVVTAQIEGRHLAGLRECRDLIAPGVVEVGKPMQQHHQRPLARGDVVNLHPLRVGEALPPPLLGVQFQQTSQQQPEAAGQARAARQIGHRGSFPSAAGRLAESRSARVPRGFPRTEPDTTTY